MRFHAGKTEDDGISVFNEDQSASAAALKIHADGQAFPDDAWVYRRARQLIEQHGDDAMMVATLLVGMALKDREKERAALMLRVRAAVAKLQQAPSEPVQ